MSKRVKDDAVAIAAGVYHIKCKHGTASVTVPHNITARTIIQCFGPLLDSAQSFKAVRNVG